MDVVYANLIPALWTAWMIYWIIAARATKDNQRKESLASRAAHLLPIAFAAAILWMPRLPGGFLCDFIVTPSKVTYFGGVAVLVAGLLFAVWARLYLGSNWSAIVTLKQDHELIRGGPYRFVRHPIYTGLLLGFIGSAIARDQWRGVLAIVIVFIALWRKLLIEERWLGEQFGAAYARYRDEVPALIPFLRPRKSRSTTNHDK